MQILTQNLSNKFKKLISQENAELVPIGKAASILGISIDTLRRWSKKGDVHCQRIGQNRYFYIKELEKINISRPLTISEVSWILHIPVSRLRKLESQGLIKAERKSNSERVFARDSIKHFLGSEYFLKGLRSQKLKIYL